MNDNNLKLNNEKVKNFNPSNSVQEILKPGFRSQTDFIRQVRQLIVLLPSFSTQSGGFLFLSVQGKVSNPFHRKIV